MTPLLLDPSRPRDFRPEPDGPVFSLRIPRVIDRPAFKRAVATAGGRFWTRQQMMLALEEAVRALMPGEAEAEARERRIGAIVEYREGIEAAVARWREERSDASNLDLLEALVAPELVVETERLVIDAAAFYPAYAEKAADLQVLAEIQGTIAAQMFLVGWEGGDLPPFRRSPKGVPEELLAELSPAQMIAIGQEVSNLMDPERGRLGNSRLASTGGSPETSSRDGSTTPESSPATGPASSSTGSDGTSSASTPPTSSTRKSRKS